MFSYTPLHVVLEGSNLPRNTFVFNMPIVELTNWKGGIRVSTTVVRGEGRPRRPMLTRLGAPSPKVCFVVSLCGPLPIWSCVVT